MRGWISGPCAALKFATVSVASAHSVMVRTKIIGSSVKPFNDWQDDLILRRILTISMATASAQCPEQERAGDECVAAVELERVLGGEDDRAVR